jgi:hypothetical protein
LAQCAPGGCTFCETPDRPADAAAVFWRSDVDEAVLPIEACSASCGRAEAFDLRRLGCVVRVLRSGDGIEHVLLGDGIYRIQLLVRKCSLLDGPSGLRYDLADFAGVEPKLMTLHRLIALRRLGRFPRSLFPLERRAPRWVAALRAFDASRVGASPREIAAALYGADTAGRDWDGASDYLRSRVRRAIAAGERLVNGGHLEILRPSR